MVSTMGQFTPPAEFGGVKNPRMVAKYKSSRSGTTGSKPVARLLFTKHVDESPACEQADQHYAILRLCAPPSSDAAIDFFHTRPCKPFTSRSRR